MIIEETVDKEGAPKVVKADEMKYGPLYQMKIPPPFPQRINKKEDNVKFKKFLAKLCNFSINIPLLEAIQEIMKTLMSKKHLVDGETIEVTQGCSAIMTSVKAVKEEDRGTFTIPWTIGAHKFEKALCDLGARINSMPCTIYKRLGLGTPTTTTMRLFIVYCSIKKPIGVLYDVFVKVDHFILLADFMVLDCKIYQKYLLSLGEPFWQMGEKLLI